MIWKSVGSLPEILNILDGVPRPSYESYHLRPGMNGCINGRPICR